MKSFSFLSIASVTATLRLVLEKAVAPDVSGVTVTTTRPDAGGGSAGDPRVNIFLYQVSPNVGLRNIDLPTRNSSGQVAQRPVLAVDLHYLLTFHGEEAQLVPQRLLGATLRTLHARPVLTRQQIDATVKNPAFPFLKDCDLAQQVEQVKFVLTSLTLEDLSKLWSVFFQTRYTLSATYQATVILIETDEMPAPPLPVRRRQLSGGASVLPSIDRVEIAGADRDAKQDPPHRPVQLGEVLQIFGRGFAGPPGADRQTLVRIGEAEIVPAPDALSDAVITLPLPGLPSPGDFDKLRAGLLGVQVIHMAKRKLIGESNVQPLRLRPTLLPGPAVRAHELTVQIRPIAGQRQRVMLLLNEVPPTAPAPPAPAPSPPREPLAYALFAAPRDQDTDQISVSLDGVQPATYLLRVQVDGVDSQLAWDEQTGFTGPTVTIP